MKYQHVLILEISCAFIYNQNYRYVKNEANTCYLKKKKFGIKLLKIQYDEVKKKTNNVLNIYYLVFLMYLLLIMKKGKCWGAVKNIFLTQLSLGAANATGACEVCHHTQR